MDRPQDTLSAREFADLTGMSRERLRTWERRHDFPTPQRRGHGPRRYRRADVNPVVSVREAVDSGARLPDAIAAARADESSPALPPGDWFGSILPLPIVVVSGPEPIRIEYANAAAADEIEAGSVLSKAIPGFAGSDAHRALLRLFARGGDPIECVNEPWSGPRAGVARSLVFRVPGSSEGGKPLAALVAVDSERERSQREHLLRVTGELEELRGESEHDRGWLELVEDLALRLRGDRAGDVIRAATRALVNRLGAEDAGVALYMTGELLLGSSARGTLGPRMVLVSRYAELGPLLSERRSVWLEAGTAEAFGARGTGSVLAVPVVAASEVVAALLIEVRQRADFDPHEQRLLDVVASIAGIAVLRDRFAEGSPQPGARSPMT